MSDGSTYATILCVGDELTEGRRQDSHAQYLAAFFRARGFTVRAALLLPDDQELFGEALAQAVRHSSVAVITGGLGPTADDLTREVVASVAGVSLELRQELWDALQNRHPHRRVSPTNRKQALVPESFEVFPNPRGTAVGLVGTVSQCIVAALPGPPKELHGMVKESLEPYLAERFSLAQEETLSATSFAIAESDLEEALQKYVGDTDIRWGTNAEEYRVTFTLRGGSAEQREAFFARLVEEYDPFRMRRGDVDPVGVAIEELRRRQRRLVCAESCTGGLVTKSVTDVPGSSDVLWGGFVSYANEAKTDLLGVREETLENHGAVSRETVEEMARGALEAAGIEDGISVAVSGIAGPEGGTPEKPVGTVWFAVAEDGEKTVAGRILLPGSRDTIRRKATAYALLLVHGVLTGEVHEEGHALLS